MNIHKVPLWQIVVGSLVFIGMALFAYYMRHAAIAGQ